LRGYRLPEESLIQEAHLQQGCGEVFPSSLADRSRFSERCFIYQ
jgi:hypothetical protein